jgi:Tol biopolymer transport system component
MPRISKTKKKDDKIIPSEPPITETILQDSPPPAPAPPTQIPIATEQISEKKGGVGILAVLFAFLLGGLLTIASYYLLTMSGMIPALSQPIVKDTNNTVKIPPKRVDSWTLPISKKKGYPLFNANDKKLSIFDIQDMTSKSTDIIITCCGGLINVGNMEPLPSPDMFYTVYIDNVKQDLWLISNDTLERAVITKGGGVTYITGWSPDSQKVVFYVDRETLASRKDGPAPWETVEKFNETQMYGFYMFDINSGKLTSLSPLQNIISFVDADTILAKTAEDSENLVTFDIKNFVADYGFVSEKFGFGTLQYSFSANGKKWVFTHSFNPTEDANIILADFPSKEGTIIDSKGWAEVQSPIISPDGTKVLYQRYDNYLEPGIPDIYVWLYDTAYKNNESNSEGITFEEDQLIPDLVSEEMTSPPSNPISVTKGRPIMWVDNSRAVVETNSLATDGTISRELMLLDLGSYRTTLMR